MVYEVKWVNAVHEVTPVSQALKEKPVAKASQQRTALKALLVKISKAYAVSKVNQAKTGLHRSKPWPKSTFPLKTATLANQANEVDQVDADEPVKKVGTALMA
jgi:hypothetical protein